MATLEFVFNQKKLAEVGKTEDELLEHFRESMNYDDRMVENPKGFFEIKEDRDGFDLSVGASYLSTIKDRNIVNLLTKWELKTEDDTEDLLEA